MLNYFVWVFGNIGFIRKKIVNVILYNKNIELVIV